MPQQAMNIPAARDAFDFAALSAHMTAAPPAADPLLGDYTGTILAIAGFQRLPHALRAPITRMACAIGQPLWRGKRFHATDGTNMWLSGRHPRTFAGYACATADDGHTILDYDQPRNPRPLRGITGELAELGPGILLGAMYLTIGRRRATLLYFTLER
ncbi:hypothetical protein IU449_24685 [Nocardia higoensis]|uniref:Uncharacterized protein n=1 Tax=Nocardia higoensis TaxID=228599 RepID=A0ABS0DL02_9NOCA|nr:hypothetical protein [Nocardia higoensis]MBF6357704.1 hypothetical protein [Nocardia higoensis]